MTARDVAARLPDIETLRKRCLAVATLDTILSPVWEDRRFSYTADWGGHASATEIRDHSGNDCFIVFTTDGVFIKGYDHESPMSPYRRADTSDGSSPTLWPGLVDGLPAVFTQFLTEPAFADPDGFPSMTFCIWRQYSDSQWHTGPVDFTGLDRCDTDGAHEMLDVLCDPTPQAYGTFAFEYFDVDINPAALEHVFALGPLTDQIVQTINPHTALDDLARELASSAYPTGLPREGFAAADDIKIPSTKRGARAVGTWGIGPFANDAASDWAGAFDATAPGDRTSFLADTFGKSLGSDCFDLDDCQQIIASAAVVAAAMPGGPPSDSEFGPATLTTDPGFAVTDDLRKTAVAALREVAAPQSEWAQLWAQSGDEAQAHWSLTQLLTDLEPYGEWAPFHRLEDAAPAYLRDPAIALGALRGIVDFDAIQAFTIERRVSQEDWGRALYQEIAVIDGERLIVWMGDDVRDDDVPLFSSEVRVIPLSWVCDVSLDERYRLHSGAQTLRSVHLSLDVAITDVATGVPESDKTELRARSFYFSKAVDDGGHDQMTRLVEFGRAAMKLAR